MLVLEDFKNKNGEYDANMILARVQELGITSVCHHSYELITCADCGTEMDGNYPNDCFGTTHGWCGECEEDED